MALITFLSDFGLSDHYVAAVKARILAKDPGMTIVDISHSIQPFDISHGSYVLAQVFRDFPKGTIHLVAVDSHGRHTNGFVALELEGHLFVGPNNGLLSMVSSQTPAVVVQVGEKTEVRGFPTFDFLADAATRLATGTLVQDLGPPCEEFVRLISRQMKATKNLISGHVIRVDNYGNLVTNIEKQAFEKLGSGKTFSVSFGRESSSVIHESYRSAEEGDCVLMFNSQDLLEIGINTGNAGELLGLQQDSPVTIHFEA